MTEESRHIQLTNQINFVPALSPTWRSKGRSKEETRKYKILHQGRQIRFWCFKEKTRKYCWAQRLKECSLLCPTTELVIKIQNVASGEANMFWTSSEKFCNSRTQFRICKNASRLRNISVNSKRYHPPAQSQGIWPNFLPEGRAFDLKIN